MEVRVSMRRAIAALVVVLIAACSSGSEIATPAPAIPAGPTPMSALSQMEMVFIGSPREAEIRALLDTVLADHGLPATEANYQKAGDALVATRISAVEAGCPESQCSEMAVLGYLAQGKLKDVTARGGDRPGIRRSGEGRRLRHRPSVTHRRLIWATAVVTGGCDRREALEIHAAATMPRETRGPSHTTPHARGRRERRDGDVVSRRAATCRGRRCHRRPRRGASSTRPGRSPSSPVSATSGRQPWQGVVTRLSGRASHSCPPKAARSSSVAATVPSVGSRPTGAIPCRSSSSCCRLARRRRRSQRSRSRPSSVSP